MCTLVILRRPDHPWPLILGANRDEMADRPWAAPARHWQDRPDLRAGLDRLAGGSWQGMNDSGVAAAILNRMGTLGPQPGKRSRGELVLEALDHADAEAAAAALSGLDPLAYRPFNLVIADNRDAFWLKNRGAEGPGRIECVPIPEGLSLLTAHDLNDPASPRIAAFLPRFRAAPAPDPDRGDWREWTALLSVRADPFEGEREDAAMNIRRPNGFGTVSSSLIAIPSAQRPEIAPIWLFAPGRPDEAEFAPVPA